MNKPKNERNSELANSKRILANYHIRKLNLTLNIKEITYDTLKTVFERININAPYNNISDSDNINAQTKQHLNDNTILKYEKACNDLQEAKLTNNRTLINSKRTLANYYVRTYNISKETLSWFITNSIKLQ